MTDCPAVRSLRILRCALIAVLLAAIVVPSAASAGSRKVPRGWLGATFTPSIALRHHSTVDHELGLMKRAGVENVRVAVYWFQIQPKRTGPLQWAGLDAIVDAAARRGLPLSPVVLGAPGWAAASRMAPIPVPRHSADYTRFMVRLVSRYGPDGTYWTSHRSVPERPIRTWQIWNEVSNAYYWSGSTWSTAYPQLLKDAYDAVKGLDPGAKVIMAGLNTTGAGAKPQTSWDALGRIYDALDAGGLGRPFDATATHIYTSRAGDAVRVMRETRKVMNAHGDRERPAEVTELAWPASKGRLRDAKGRKRTFFAETDEKGMAARLTTGVLALAKQRKALGIGSVDWFQWISPYSGSVDAFSYSGLRRAHRQIVDTPAMTAFKNVARRLEGRRIPR
jgi:hypothetical protein